MVSFGTKCMETIVVLCLCCSYVSGHLNEELLYCVDGLMGVFLVLPGLLVIP